MVQWLRLQTPGGGREAQDGGDVCVYIYIYTYS